MRDWRAASEKIRRRTVLEIAESLAIESPFHFSAVSTQSDTSAYLDSNWDILAGAPDYVLSFPGRDASYVNDSLICVAKFWHVVERARTNFDLGALTWTVVDAYHACLLGARAISALSGVLSYSLRGRTVLVDFRPEFGSPDDRKAFKKAHGAVDDPVRVLRPLNRQLLEQKDTWAVLTRICALSTATDPNKDCYSRISSFAEQPLSQPRNMVFYDSVAWLWRTDFRVQGDGVEFEQSVASLDGNVDATLAALNEIFGFSKILLAELSSRIGFDPSTLSVMATTEPDKLLKAS